MFGETRLYSLNAVRLLAGMTQLDPEVEPSFQVTKVVSMVTLPR
jgi:hypothetical protein